MTTELRAERVQVPTAEISLAELRTFIDLSNNLLLVGLQQIIDNSTDTPLEHSTFGYIQTWAVETAETGIPHSVLIELVRIMTSGSIQLTTYVRGLDIVSKALQIRFAATRKVGELKAIHNMPVLDQPREDAILAKMSQEVTAAHLPDELVNFFLILMTAVRDEHTEIRDELSSK